MNIRKAVARELAGTEWFDWAAENFDRSIKLEHGGDCTKEAYSCPRCYAEEILEVTDAAITAFLKASAKKGWQMRPDEATEEMQAQYLFGSTAGSAWRFFCKAAPKFEWDK